MKAILAIGDHVKKILPKLDYTYGREGIIIEINETTQRYRILWNFPKVKTWVTFKNVEKL